MSGDLGRGGGRGGEGGPGNFTRPSVQLHTPLAPATVKREAVAQDPLAFAPLTISHEEVETSNTTLDTPNQASSTLKVFGSVENLVSDFYAECSVLPIDPNILPKNLQSVIMFSRHNMWRSVLDVSSIFPLDPSTLTNKESLPHEVLTMLSLRYEALFRLKMFDELSAEAGKVMAQLAILEDEPLPDDKNRPQEALRIALTILLAETQLTTGHGNEALGHLLVRRLTNRQQEPVDKQMIAWNQKLTLSIVNMFLRQHQWSNALAELKSILTDLKTSSFSVGIVEILDEGALYEVLLLCKLARVEIHIGDIISAERYLQFAKEAMIRAGSGTLCSSVEDYLVLTGGVLLQAKDQYESAMKLFDSVIQSQLSRQRRVDVLDSNYFQDNEIYHKFDFFFMVEGLSGDSLMNIAVNNYAVCSVFLKKVNIAMRKLECVIQNSPVQNMNDAVVFNLCTLYDLSFSPDISTNKKKVLQHIASMYSIEAINWRSFRLA